MRRKILIIPEIPMMGLLCNTINEINIAAGLKKIYVVLMSDQHHWPWPNIETSWVNVSCLLAYLSESCFSICMVVLEVAKDLGVHASTLVMRDGLSLPPLWYCTVLLSFPKACACFFFGMLLKLCFLSGPSLFPPLCLVYLALLFSVSFFLR